MMQMGFQAFVTTVSAAFVTFTLWCVIAHELMMVEGRRFEASPKLLLPQMNGTKEGANARRKLGDSSSKGTFNQIDNCWRGDPNWAQDRKRLADCAIGYGSNTVGGKNGEYYLVTDDGDDAVNPSPGTLRYGAMQLTPLWIIFERDMNIHLQNELIIMSDKTIDGRGARVHIGNGPCLTIQDVDNVIIHGLHISNCQPGRPGDVRSSTAHVGYRQGSDGDGISVFSSHNVWIDHNTFSSSQDGLLDVIRGSTGITISNNAFTDHDKVMLLGHDDNFAADANMRISICFNRFGPGLVQRMPRCRLGYFHIFNNEYIEWGMYAIGGSANPTIISEHNRYQASDSAKEVTKRDSDEGPNVWGGWKWESNGDLFLNGAFFVESGDGGGPRPIYGHQPYEEVAASSYGYVLSMTSSAGALSCSPSRRC
ncbi:hypothetical protein KP509_22G068000 [Ceratopteris richardii]|uniref:Pectate lyase n=1 Tax=Ceratopteris richardii TaxID=49495 RepID=A0A8T2S8S3_CERRI|nr:hypothetical protein KP509_22G068000 [Ceratopteris richardii]